MKNKKMKQVKDYGRRFVSGFCITSISPLTMVSAGIKAIHVTDKFGAVEGYKTLIKVMIVSGIGGGITNTIADVL